MPSGAAKADIKLGFYVAIGFLLLGLVVGLIQLMLGKVTGK